MSAVDMTIDVREPGLLSPEYRAMTIGMVALVSLSAFEALAVATAMPTVAQALNGLALYALAFGGTLAASVVGMIVSGRWSDTRGPAPPLWHGVAWFAAGLLVSGFAPDMLVLIAGRVVQGFGLGLMSVALYVVVAQVYPAALRPRVFAAFSAAWVIPSVIGPTISGFIVEHVGWRWVFLAVPFLALPAAWMLRPGLRALPPVAAAANADGARRVACSVGAAVCACVLHYVGQRPEGSASFVAIALAFFGLVLFVRELLPAGTLTARRGLPAVIALRGIAAATFFNTEVFVPLMLARERGLSPVWAGVALTVGALGWSAGSWYQGNRKEQGTRTRVLRIGMVMLGLGIAILATVVWREVPAVVGVAGWTLAGVGMGLVYPVLAVLSLELSAPGEQGVNSSALQLADALSVAAVLALCGSLFALLLPVSGAAGFAACFAVSVAAAVVGFFVAGRCRAA